MQLEEAYIIVKLMEGVDSKEDPLILEQTVRRHKHNHRLNNATDSLKTLDRITDRNETNKGYHSREDKRQMAR
jgi:hypothetical protein